jgi:hypothetical protein
MDYHGLPTPRTTLAAVPMTRLPALCYPSPWCNLHRRLTTEGLKGGK